MKVKWPWEIRDVDLSDAFVDYGYQRPTRAEWVSEMADDAVFRPELFGVLVMSQRKDGRYAILDGANRYHVALERGIDSVQTEVHTGMKYADEADVFLELNFARNAVRPYERFRAMLEAKVPMALQMKEITERCGFFVATSASGENDIGAIAALEEVFLVMTHDASTVTQRHSEVRRWLTGSQTNGPDLLEATLRSIRGAWEDRETWPQGKAGNMIRGVARFLSKHPNVSAQEMIKVLKHADPLAIQVEARVIQKPGAGSGKGRPVEHVIDRLYKKHGNKQLLAGA